ncbi:MAG: T9SS type A sorting domain-containing protein, partial [Bacteroidota bacterium]
TGSTSGSEPGSDVAVSLNKTTLDNGSYFTLVGNPFASNFNTNNLTVDAGAIQNNIVFWDNAGGSYSTQDRTASSGYIIAPWQGFWVEVASGNAATQVTFPTAGKTSSSTTDTFFGKSAEQRGDLGFALTSETTNDESIRLSFRENATLGYDLSDASKFVPLLTEYATMAFVGNVEGSDKLQSVFSVPFDLTEEITIPLEPSFIGVSGAFTLSWGSLEQVPANMELTLYDYKTGAVIDLSEQNEYAFEVEETQQKSARSILDVQAVEMVSEDTNRRFALVLTPSQTTVSNEEEVTVERFALDQNYPNPFNPTTNIRYTVPNSGLVNVSVYNVMGQKVATLVNSTQSAGTYTSTWNAASSASGIYYYRLESAGQSITRQMTL